MRLPRMTTRRMMVLVLLVALVSAALRADPSMAACVLIPVTLATAIVLLVPRFVGRRPTATFALAVVIGGLLAPFLGSAIVSKVMWGYHLGRPAPDRRIVEARRVASVTIVQTVPDDNGGLAFMPRPSASVARKIAFGRDNPYYSLEERVLIALSGSRAPAGRPGAQDHMGSGDALQPPGTDGATGGWQAGILAPKEDLGGAVIEAVGADGAPLLFVGVSGGEVSNGHYPYYEFLFSGTPPGGKPRLLSSRRFYFDIAGIEGVEWPAFFFVFSMVGLVLTTPVAVVGLLIRRPGPTRVGAPAEDARA